MPKSKFSYDTSTARTPTELYQVAYIDSIMFTLLRLSILKQILRTKKYTFFNITSLKDKWSIVVKKDVGRKEGENFPFFRNEYHVRMILDCTLKNKVRLCTLNGQCWFWDNLDGGSKSHLATGQTNFVGNYRMVFVPFPCQLAITFLATSIAGHHQQQQRYQNIANSIAVSRINSRFRD